MKIFSMFVATATVVFISACSSTPVYVDYDASVKSANDFLPLPADAPNSVEVADVMVPRLKLDVAGEQADQSSTPFVVEEVIDSLGNKSLKLNRTAATSWEIVDQALTEQGFNTSDRNRSEYRFDLAAKDRSQSLLKRIFGKKPAPLSLVLIPQGQSTLLSLEAGEDLLPEDSEVDRVFSALLEQWAE